MQSFYNGLNGMTNFSKSLDNVSNNISNMNTPGFKGNDVFIRSLGDGANAYGSQVDASSVRTQSGDLRQTGNETDLAITGAGYFVLRNDEGKLFYTRAGQFKFDENDKLVDSASGFSVMFIDDLGILKELDITDQKTLPAVATSKVDMLGNLNMLADATTAPHVINNVGVFDAKGTMHNLKMEFTKAAAPAVNTWQVAVKNNLDQVLTTFSMQFGLDSTPLSGSNKISKAITFNGVAQNVEFNFGDTGSRSGSTQDSGSNTLSALIKDGHDVLGLRSLTFKEDGAIQLKYANGEEKTGDYIGLANINDPEVLQVTSNGLYSADTSQKFVYGKANKGVFGAIQGKSLEMSNVDLTQEFADILIIQRGYQASSRVMSVSNDMLEQLYNSTRTR